MPPAGAVPDCAPEPTELHVNETVQRTALRLHRVDGDEIGLSRRPITEAGSETIDLPPLEPGDFRAEWRIISADGLPVRGVIPRSVSGACRP